MRGGPRCARRHRDCRASKAERFARQYDRGSTTGGDGIVALAGVERTVCSDAADLLIWRDLIEQLGQHRRVTNIAGGELGGPDFQCLFINSDVALAPDTPLRVTMLAGIPLAFALDLDACAVDQQVQRTACSTVGNVYLQGLLATAQGAEVRHRPV
jgi:hypothetical protein